MSRDIKCIKIFWAELETFVLTSLSTDGMPFLDKKAIT